ncbi:MAG: YfiR family protein [Steroidobacter sp.]
MRRFARCALLGLLCAFAPLHAGAQSQTASADSVKAAFLYHFSGYVEWPQVSAGGPVTIGVMGSETIVGELRQLLPGRSIDGRPVRVRALSPDGNLSGLHVLFIGEREHRRARQVIDALQGAPTLTVTDHPEGLERGAMINFVISDNRVRFEISQAQAERVGLRLSSRLLAVATRVRSTGVQLQRSPAMTAANARPRA